MNGAPAVVVRYGEIGLKGGNRREFERALQARVKSALSDLPHGPVERPHGRIVVRDPADPRRVAERVARVFGVTSASPAVAVDRTLEAISEAGTALAVDAARRRGAPDGTGLTFRVSTTRADKRFPHPSPAVNEQVAAAVLEALPGLTVRLKDAELVVGVEIRSRETLVHAERFPGPGGLPGGSIGRAIVLFSGGIDSPVAAWLAMKRGLDVELLHFHAAPFVGDASKEKAVDLARVLSRWCGSLTLVVVPFADVQVEIRRSAPAPVRTLLYRRSMNRIAARHAAAYGALALVTGESLGQVASQTLENLSCIEDAADRLVLRPLVAYDKHEAVALARRIGTFDVSVRPHPDCCTLFMPRHPRIKGDVDELRDLDRQLDLAAAEDDAWARREEIHLREGDRVEV